MTRYDTNLGRCNTSNGPHIENIRPSQKSVASIGASKRAAVCTYIHRSELDNIRPGTWQRPLLHLPGPLEEMMASFVYREDGSSIKKSAITSGMAGSPASASIADSISIRAEHGTADRPRSKSPANAQFTKPDQASTSKFVFKSLDPPPRLPVNQPHAPTSHSSEPATKTHPPRPPSLSPRKPHVSESGPSRGTSAPPVGGKGLSSSAGVPESLLKRLAGPSTNKAGLLREWVTAFHRRYVLEDADN